MLHAILHSCRTPTHTLDHYLHASKLYKFLFVRDSLEESVDLFLRQLVLPGSAQTLMEAPVRRLCDH